MKVRFHKHEHYTWLQIGKLKIAIFKPDYNFITGHEQPLTIHSFGKITIKIYWSI